MSEIVLQVPDVLGELPGAERDLLLGRALRSAVKERLGQVELEIEEGQAHIAALEKKYTLSFQAFEKKIETLEHVDVDCQEDYIDWYAWIESTKRAEQVAETLRQFLAI